MEDDDDDFLLPPPPTPPCLGFLKPHRVMETELGEGGMAII